MTNHTTISTATYRVKLKPYLDLWMQGARYGEVMREYKSRKFNCNMVVVKLDAINKPIRLYAHDVEAIES